MEVIEMTVKNIREKLKLTQSKLAEILDVDTQTISAWENYRAEPSFINGLKLKELEESLDK